MKKGLIISYSILSLGVLLSIVLSFVGLHYNVDSIYDEGFLFLSQRSACAGAINGMSLGPNIIAATLGDACCSTIFNLRLVGLIVELLSAVIFFLLTYNLFCSRRSQTIGYLIICLLFVVPSLGGVVVCANELAKLFLCTTTALGIRVLLTDDWHWNTIWCVLIGVSGTLGVFCILPSAILLLICLFILLLIKNWKQWTIITKYVLLVLFGFGVGLLIVHCFVADLSLVFHEMAKVATTVTTLQRGYDPLSFLIKFILFVRDWALCCVVILGCVYVSDKISSFSTKWIANIFFIVILLIYVEYQIKPQITTPMVMSVMWLILLYNDSKICDRKSVLNFDMWLNLFLIFSPVILSIGTNTYLGGKMAHFMLPWAILLCRLGWNKDNVPLRMIVSVFVVVLLSYHSLPNTIASINSQTYEVKQGILKNMYLTEQQKKHFDLCDSIMAQYNFQPAKSVIYSTQLGMMTVCYLGGVNCANYFQPMDFVTYARNDKLSRPDFMFLSDYDLDISGKELEQIGWGWPDEFDVYDVGTPETIEVGYPTTRKLYCRKSLKKND